MSGKVQPIPKGYEGATPYLIIKGASNALDFYKKAFGATEIIRIDLFNVGIFSIGPAQADAAADQVAGVTAQLYCERMEFKLMAR